MAIRYEGDLARLDATCTVEEALELADWLRAQADPRVDLASCAHLHTAVLQTLLALRPRIAGPPADPFLARWVAPLLAPAPAEAPPAGGRSRRRKNKNLAAQPGSAV
jgi:hypothetical protein